MKKRITAAGQKKDAREDDNLLIMFMASKIGLKIKKFQRF